MMSQVVFSVIMPVYNASSTLSESIDSVLGQTFGDFELLIVDDCSTDDSRFFIECYARKDARIAAIYSDVNQGVALARNLAITAAKGRYITFLDADDLWLPEKLEAQYEEFCQGAHVVYASYVRFSNESSEQLIIAPSCVNFDALLRGNCIGNLTGAYDSCILGKYFQESVGHEDYLMWLRILASGVSARGINRPLARYRVASSSLSANKLRAAGWVWKIYRRKLKLNLLFSIELFLSYVVSALIKRV